MVAQLQSDILQPTRLAEHRGGLGTALNWPGHNSDQPHTGAWKATLLWVVFSNSCYWGRRKSGNLYLHFQLCLWPPADAKMITGRVALLGVPKITCDCQGYWPCKRCPPTNYKEQPNLSMCTVPCNALGEGTLGYGEKNSTCLICLKTREPRYPLI